MKSTREEKPTARLLEYAGNYRYLAIASWVLAFISAFLALVPFYYIWKIIRDVIRVAPEYSREQHLSAYGWYAVGFAVLAMLVYMLGLVCSHLAAFRVQAEMRSRMMTHITTLPMGFMDEEGSGRIRKIVDESSAATETYLAHQLPDKWVATATPIGLVLLLLVFDWRLGLLSLIPVGVGFLIMSSMMGSRMQVKMQEYQNALEEMSSEAVEYVRGIPVVKTFGQSVFSFKRFRDSIKKYEKWTISYTEDLRTPMVLLTTAINAVFAILIASTFWLGEIHSGGANSAFLLNLMFYIIITPIITVTMTKMMYAGENMMVVEDALKRTDGILTKAALPQSGQSEHPQNSSVTLKNVSYRYEGGKQDAVHDINLDVRPGEHVALVGPSGGGKSTLAKLIARFADPYEGSVQIGNVDVRNMESGELMDTVSFVFQDSRLLKMSILDNVRMGNRNATREQVLEALKAAQCEDILAKLPEGIDTVIGAKGTYLSGGEAQRIAIARAILKDAPILILDEATAFADPDNEAKVQAAFSRLSQGKTVIMIAHRLSSVTGADRICVLQNGEICQSGTHEELLAQGGMYEHMWKEFNQSVSWKVGE